MGRASVQAEFIIGLKLLNCQFIAFKLMVYCF